MSGTIDYFPIRSPRDGYNSDPVSNGVYDTRLYAKNARLVSKWFIHASKSHGPAGEVARVIADDFVNSHYAAFGAGHIIRQAGHAINPSHDPRKRPRSTYELLKGYALRGMGFIGGVALIANFANQKNMINLIFGGHNLTPAVSTLSKLAIVQFTSTSFVKKTKILKEDSPGVTLDSALDFFYRFKALIFALAELLPGKPIPPAASLMASTVCACYRTSKDIIKDSSQPCSRDGARLEARALGL